MPRRPASLRSRRGARALAVVALAAPLLAGCVGAADASPSATTATPSASASGSPTTASPAPTTPGIVPDGTADENLPFFAGIVDQVWVGPDNASGRAYIDALVAAGFDKTAMQVTEDQSTVGNRAESLQFSVQWGQECLVGQVGPATGDPVAVVVPALAEGGCLIGSTRPIDW